VVVVVVAATAVVVSRTVAVPANLSEKQREIPKINKYFKTFIPNVKILHIYLFFILSIPS